MVYLTHKYIFWDLLVGVSDEVKATVREEVMEKLEISYPSYFRKIGIKSSSQSALNTDELQVFIEVFNKHFNLELTFNDVVNLPSKSVA